MLDLKSTLPKILSIAKLRMNYGQLSGGKFDTYIPYIWGLTGIYLTFELAFNSRLLDVAGGLTRPDQVNSIEHWGRFISGTALALAVWGMVVMPRGVAGHWQPKKWAMMLSLSAIVSISIVYNFEKKLIDTLTDGSSAEAHRIATQLQITAHAVLTQDVRIDGIDLSPQQLATPEGKTFIALFPVLAFSTNDLTHKIEHAIREIIRINVVQHIGTKEQYYNKTYVQSLRKIQDSFNNQYRVGATQMHQVLDDIPKTQAEAWDRYARDLGEHGYRPDTVPPRGWGRVRASVRGKGVPVPNDWNPRDKNTFYRVLRDKIEHDAARKYQSAIQQQFGTGSALPDNLQWSQFIVHPLIQRRWHDAIHLSSSVVLMPNMDVETYSRLAYIPLIDQTVDEQFAKKYTAEAATFGPGGQNEALGSAAMRALLVPPIALGFSLIGALVHVLKFLLYSARFVSPNKTLNLRVAGATVVTIALGAFVAQNAITTSRAYDYLQNQTKNTLGFVPSRALTWVIQAQPFAYPINEMVRVHGLGGITFGYTPDQTVSVETTKL